MFGRRSVGGQGQCLTMDQPSHSEGSEGHGNFVFVLVFTQRSIGVLMEIQSGPSLDLPAW